MHELGSTSAGPPSLFVGRKRQANVGTLDQGHHQMLQEVERLQLWLAATSLTILFEVLNCVITHEGVSLALGTLLASLHVSLPKIYKKAVLLPQLFHLISSLPTSKDYTSDTLTRTSLTPKLQHLKPRPPFPKPTHQPTHQPTTHHQNAGQNHHQRPRHRHRSIHPSHHRNPRPNLQRQPSPSML